MCKIVFIFVCIEEMIPGLDVIPTFTLMWLYTFVWIKTPQMQAIIIDNNSKT